ncbi:hypothetical protein DVH24_019734 [Malus domestica]|uniref:Uncharacterized protein n=1 Tax=Malus domestica TaxID=3750 RepID=A0A498HZQ7_MALDO|nr:hypothetical protein DVH24_019734 [Malus domestica]
MLRRSRDSKLHKMIQKDHIVGSSSGLKVCDKPGFEPKNKRPKIVDNVCLTIQTSVDVVMFDSPNQISKGRAYFQRNKKGLRFWGCGSATGISRWGGGWSGWDLEGGLRPKVFGKRAVVCW